MLKIAPSELIRTVERHEYTVMIRYMELRGLARDVEDLLTEIISDMHYSYSPSKQTATSESTRILESFDCVTRVGSTIARSNIEDLLTKISDMLDSCNPFFEQSVILKFTFSGRAISTVDLAYEASIRVLSKGWERGRVQISKLVFNDRDNSTWGLPRFEFWPFERSFPERLIMGFSRSAEVDNAADKCSSIPGRATTLLGIENPRQRQEDKATAPLSPLSRKLLRSPKKIVEITNAKSHHHVSNESGGNNNEVTELLGHTDVEADKPASSVSRKRIRSQGRKSRAWLHFPNVERNAGNRITKAQCTYCDTWLEADPVRDGTSRLLRHITDHHKLDLDASPETNKKRMTLAIKAKNQSRDQTAANWGGIVPDKVPNEDSILDSQDSVGKISRLEGQLLDKINSASQEGILVLDEEDDDVTAERDEYVLQRRAAERNDVEYLDDNREVTAIAGSRPPRPTTASRNTQGKEKKKLKRSARIEEMMENFPQTREEESARLAKQAEEESARLAKQAEEESARLVREKEAAESNDFSIKRCISVLNTLEVTKEEKAKAYAVFSKSKENREIFICSCEADVESTLIWLRNEMV